MNILKSELHCPDPPRIPLAEYVLREIKSHQNGTAFVNPVTKDEYSFQYIATQTERLSASLQHQGLVRGDRIAFCTPNSVEAIIAILASSRCGATITLANPLYTHRELEHFIKVAEPTYWFCVPAVLPRIAHTQCKQIFLFSPDDSGNYITYEQLIETTYEEQFESPILDFDEDLATLPFSSGTTGLPKGVMLTHKNVVTGLVQTKSWLEDLTEKDTTVCFLPLFHQYGLMLILYCLARGVKAIVMSRFSLPDLLQNIQTYKVTVIPLVPPVAVLLAKHPLVDNYDITSVKAVLNSAAALTRNVADLLTKRTNALVKQGYGMTETTFGALYTAGDVKPGAIGRLLPFVEAKVIDLETEEALGPNHEGEICLHGALVMKGYRSDEESTRSCLDENGWIKTGDIGYYDETGIFWYKDRKKELIKYNAYQVPPAELEGLLASHPELSDAAVIGIPDESAGELPRAYVVKKEGATITEKEIAEFVASNVAPFKKLRGGVFFVDAIPRSASGKILRRELKAQALEELKVNH